GNCDSASFGGVRVRLPVQPSRPARMTRTTVIRANLAEEDMMLNSIIIPNAVFLLALGASYAITRPIGDARRLIASTSLSAGLGARGGFIASDMGIPLCSALAGAIIGMVLAWHRRNPSSAPRREPDNPRRWRGPHYGTSRT